MRLTETQARILRRWARARTAVAVRARIVLACAEGDPNAAVARRLGVSRNTVASARDRFLREGLAGLADRPRSGRPRRISDQQRASILAVPAVDPPSTRVTAAATSVSQSTVSRVRRGARPNT